MPATYQDDFVSFQYPDNWTLDSSEKSDDARVQLTLSSPNTAFWTLSVYPGVLDAASLANEVLQAMQSEYPGLESDPAQQQVAGKPLVGIDMSFYCMDLTNTATVRVFTIGNDTALLLTQAEDRELESVEPVFQAITHSLLTG